MKIPAKSPCSPQGMEHCMLWNTHVGRSTATEVLSHSVTYSKPRPDFPHTLELPTAYIYSNEADLNYRDFLKCPPIFYYLKLNCHLTHLKSILINSLLPFWPFPVRPFSYVSQVQVVFQPSQFTLSFEQQLYLKVESVSMNMIFSKYCSRLCLNNGCVKIIVVFP